MWHLNEGHAAFVVLQRIRDLIETGESFDAALEEVRRTTVFTTHTPVPAGHDAFPFNLVETHLAGLLGLARRVPRRASCSSAHYDNGSGPQFNMTALALRTASGVNARQPAARRASRARCGGRSGRACAEDQRPVRAITNGVHMPTWLSHEMARLFDDYLPAGLARAPRRSRGLGRASSTSPTRSCGRRAARCASTCSRSSASARAQRWRDEQVSAPRASSPPARCSIPTR